VFKLKQFLQWIVGPSRDPVDAGTRRGLLLTGIPLVVRPIMLR
jgi:hypothetical protein